MKTLFATALLLGCAWCIARGAAQQPNPAETAAAIPFFEAETLQVANGVGVGLFSSLTDQRFLYAVQLGTGRQLARIDDVGHAVFGFDGRRIVYAPEKASRLTSLELSTLTSTNIWTGPDGSVIRSIHISGARISLAVESGDGLDVVHLDASGGQRDASPHLMKPDVAFDVFLSDGAALILRRDGGGSWWSGEGEWQAMRLPDDVRVRGIVGNRLIGINPSLPRTLLRAELAANQPIVWQALYAATGPIVSESIRPADEESVTFLEQAGSSLSVAWLPLDESRAVERVPVPSRVPSGDDARHGWSRDDFAWPERRDGRLYLAAVPLPHPAAAPLPSRPPVVPAGHRDRDLLATRGIEWLKRQMGPIFMSREGRTARLIDSYEDADRAGWIYDGAIAAIALTASDERDTARDVLSGLEHLQNDDGSWVFSYDPDLAAPRGHERYVGSMAWVIMAANFYEWETGDRRFAPMARRGLTYLERFRIGDAGSELYGGFTMGPDKPDVLSTEHNADCYAAFSWRGRLENNARDESIAGDIRAFVLRQIWTTEGGANGRQFFKVGARERDLYLDAQTWTTLAFGGGLEDERLQSALMAADRALAVDDGRSGSAVGIVGLDDTEHGPGQTKVWAEGTEGMVAALLSMGEVARARRYHLGTASYQTASGGVPYATENTLGWPTAPAVAATAWFVLNRLSPPRNPFNPDVNAWQASHPGQETLIR